MARATAAGTSTRSARRTTATPAASGPTATACGWPILWTPNSTPTGCPNKGRDASKDFNTLGGATNSTPTGIWSDGDTMWVADFDDTKLYAYRMSDKEHDIGRDFNTLSGAGNTLPYDIWSDGTTMWVADSFEDKVFSYNMPPPPEQRRHAQRPHGQPHGHHRLRPGPDRLRGRHRAHGDPGHHHRDSH